MTINEYMSNLTLESMTVANEMACDSMLVDFYATYADESSVANESFDLAFDDDDDDFGYSSTEPATEAGFFKSLGAKFKGVIEKVKGWFEKVASTIKGWITKFTGFIKDKVAAVKAKRQAQKIAGIDADMKSATDSIAKKKQEISERITNLKTQEQNETNASKRTRIDAEIIKLNKQLEELDSKAGEVVDKAAIEKARIYARNISEGVKQADAKFKIACGYQVTVEKMMFRIMHTKIEKGNRDSALVKDKITYNNSGDISDTSSAKTALTAIDIGSSMRNQLDKAMDELVNIESDVKAAVSKVDDAYTEFSNTVKTQSAMITALQTIKFTFPAADLVKQATDMEKVCKARADEAGNLAKLFDPSTDANGQDNRPEIAKTLSVYSSVASKLVSIASSYLTMAGKGELAVIATAVMTIK